MMEFSAKNLKLKPEHLKDLRPVKSDEPKRQRQKREFIQITREQSDRLNKASHAAEIVFRHLLFIDWKSPGRVIHLANAALAQSGVSRHAKYRALSRLKKLGLIKLIKRPHKSPGVIVR
jgi:hypothetical protein